MSKLFIKFLMFFTLIFCSITSFGQTKDIFEEADNFIGQRQYKEAISSYQKVFNETSDLTTKAKAIYNIGLTYQKLKQYDRAVETFNQVFAINAGEVESGGNALQLFKSYRSSAQWEIGRSLFAKGDYEGAVAAFHTYTEKYPSQSWCGTGRISDARKIILYEAVSLEYLGRYNEAVALYLRVDHPRMAEIYEAGGQLEDLKSIIAKKDEPKILELQKKYAWTREYIAKSLSTKELTDAIKIYDLEKANNVNALINLAQDLSKNKVYGREDIVAKMLARHPQQTVSFINSVLKKDGYLPKYFFRILGFTGTPEAVATLQSLAEKETNSWNSMALVESLNLAGENGEIVLNRLGGKTLSPNMNWALRRYKNSEVEDDIFRKLNFSPVPQTKLPVESKDL